ncbi:MAG TPA: VWA domain-containing protein [Fimbriiglobus sp.]|jgi:hypothetical protein
MSFLNIAILAGLAAVVIPPIVHLFNRKKYDVLDWAAMQFLDVSPRTRKKLFLEHFWLMLLRMALVGLVVSAFAAPTVTSSLFNYLGSRGERDVVIVIDGSASMAYRHRGTTGTDAAKDAARDVIDRLRSGDRVAIILAKQQPQMLLGSLTEDRDRARNTLDLVPVPRGTGDLPAAVQAAQALLELARPDRDVIVLTDDQRYGWADEGTVGKWDLVGKVKTLPVQTWVLNVSPDRPSDPANGALEPITAGRAVATAGLDIRFKSAIRFSGAGKGPGNVKLDIDGRPAGDLKAEGPTANPAPLGFTRKFNAGSHLVTLTLEPDDLPGDNRQDYAVEVLPAVPVLIVDGDPNGRPDTRGADFLKTALAPAKDTRPGFIVRVINISEFTGRSPFEPVTPRDANSLPRVVVLANLAGISPEQSTAVEKYASEGGSVLVAMGDRGNPRSWNAQAFKAGRGWLPALVVEPVGSEAEITTAPRPLPASYTHPAFEIFKDPLPGGFATAYFPRRWKLDPAGGVNGRNGSSGLTICSLTTGEPLFVERGVGRGRVILSAVPLDNSWRTNLTRLPDFIRLAHELVYYLAGAKAAERNLSAGQPIVFTPRPAEPPAAVTVYAPEAAPRVLPVDKWPLVFNGTKDPGAYKLVTAAGQVQYFAVRTDPRESVLTPNSADDRKKIAEAVPGMQYVNSLDDIETQRGSGPQTREIWWVLLLIVIGILGVEVWYTRRLAKKGEG